MRERPLSAFAYPVEARTQDVRGAGGVFNRNLSGAQKLGIERFFGLWFILRLVRIDFAVFQCPSSLGTKTTTTRLGTKCLDRASSEGATERSFLSDAHHHSANTTALTPPNDLTGQRPWAREGRFAVHGGGPSLLPPEAKAGATQTTGEQANFRVRNNGPRAWCTCRSN